MKEYIVTLKDKRTGETLFELNARAFSLQVNGDTNKLVAWATLEEEKTPKVYELEETEECFHEWSTYLGLAFTDSTCKKCGAENK